MQYKDDEGACVCMRPHRLGGLALRQVPAITKATLIDLQCMPCLGLATIGHASRLTLRVINPLGFAMTICANITPPTGRTRWPQVPTSTTITMIGLQVIVVLTRGVCSALQGFGLTAIRGQGAMVARTNCALERHHHSRVKKVVRSDKRTIFLCAAQINLMHHMCSTHDA